MKNDNLERWELLALTWLWSSRGKAAKATAILAAIKKYSSATSGELLAPLPDRLESLHQIQKMPTSGRGKKAAASYTLTAAGEVRVKAFTGLDEPPAGTAAAAFKKITESVVPAMVAKLAPVNATPAAAKVWTKMLPWAVCDQRFNLGLPLKDGIAACGLSLVRSALAGQHGVTIDKIHLKKLPTGELPALVAAPLLQAPGATIVSLGGLIEATALATLGILKATQLKPALVSKWLDETPLAAAISPAAIPGDGQPFAQQVQESARAIAHDRRFANNLGDQVLVYFLWEEFQRRHGQMGLEQFRQRLIQASNASQLVLVREDLVPEDRWEDFRKSQVNVGASVYHYVRLQR